ncbi:MAG: hypothetical protein ACOY82_04745 [Pseudomonadota bacterium]
MYYFVEPEVAGGWGDGTLADTSVHPPVVNKLHYHFDDWLGDDLLETFPCFIVSEKLKDDIVGSGLTGFEIDDVLVTMSDDFELPAGVSIFPNFYWLKAKKTDQAVDFKISADNRLMVSSGALAVMKRHSLSHADIDPIS